MIDPRRPLVVMYHYVWPDDADVPGGIRPMRVSAFEAQLDHLSTRYDLVDPRRFLERLDETSERPPCLLTFDDGTRDHASVVTPILARRGIGGLFFIISDAARGRLMPTTHLVHWLLGQDDEAVWEALRRYASGTDGGAEMLGTEVEARRVYHYETPTRGRIKFALNMAMPARHARDFATSHLAASGIDESTLARRWFAGETELRAMHASGMTLAVHGKTHASLQQLGAQIVEEIEDCAAFLRAITSETPRWWACPFGGSGASSKAHLAMQAALREAGIVAAVSTISGSASAGCNPLMIPRVDCVGVSLVPSPPVTGEREK